jgi:hypothetical protein
MVRDDRRIYTNFLHAHAQEIINLVEAAEQEHGGSHYEPECPICIALAALNKEQQ